MTDIIAKLDAIEVGLEGVTSGPWAFVPHYFSDGSIKRRSVCVERSKYDWIDLIGDLNNAPDAAHIARLDPDTVRELVRLARIGVDAPAIRAAERERIALWHAAEERRWNAELWERRSWGGPTMGAEECINAAKAHRKAAAAIRALKDTSE